MVVPPIPWSWDLDFCLKTGNCTVERVQYAALTVCFAILRLDLRTRGTNNVLRLWASPPVLGSPIGYYYYDNIRIVIVTRILLITWYSRDFLKQNATFYQCTGMHFSTVYVYLTVVYTGSTAYTVIYAPGQPGELISANLSDIDKSNWGTPNAMHTGGKGCGRCAILIRNTKD